MEVDIGGTQHSRPPGVVPGASPRSPYLGNYSKSTCPVSRHNQVPHSQTVFCRQSSQAGILLRTVRLFRDPVPPQRDDRCAVIDAIVAAKRRILPQSSVSLCGVPPGRSSAHDHMVPQCSVYIMSASCAYPRVALMPKLPVFDPQDCTFGNPPLLSGLLHDLR